MTRPRRYLKKDEKENVLVAVAASGGYVQPTAARLGMPHMTVADQWNKYIDSGIALTERSKDGQSLANRFLAVALAAQDRVMELIGEEKSAYRAGLLSGINLDKYLLLTGRPTSRTEIMKARYVEPGALRAIAGRVVDVPGRMSQEPTNSRPPKSLGEMATAHRPANVTVESSGADVAE